jgi:hypothetical protein
MSAPVGSPPDKDGFLAAVGEFAASLGWRVRSFTRDEELVAVVALEGDPSFEQALWIYDTSRAFVRCLLVHRGAVPVDREPAIVELCARINDGLVFGCAEYSFADRALAFRESFQLGFGDIAECVTAASTRLLQLGSRYSPAVRAALAGRSAEDAMEYVGEARKTCP